MGTNLLGGSRQVSVMKGKSSTYEILRLFCLPKCCQLRVEDLSQLVLDSFSHNH